METIITVVGGEAIMGLIEHEAGFHFPICYFNPSSMGGLKE